MNTRLQVEHPVTESITGLDLVEQMIRVAAGEPLAFAQDEIARKRLGDRVPHQRRGSAARLPAEHRPAGHVPAAGADARTPARRVPAGRRGVRVDTGVYEGGEIPIHYDSMICKLIAVRRRPRRGDRDDARRAQRLRDPRRRRATSRSRRRCSAIRASPSGDFNTGFIAEEYPHGFGAATVAHADRDFLLALAAAFERRLLARSAGITGQLPGHELQLGERFVVVEVDADGKRSETPVEVRVDGARLPS